MTSSKGTEKVLEKIKDSVESGNHYEAHQMIRTVCRRYVKQKKYDIAIDLLFSGVQTLLSQKQSGSGLDLSLYMMDVYIEGELQVSDESRDRVVQLLGLFPPEEPGRKRFIDSAVSWSIKFGESPSGDPKLHQFIAELLWKDNHRYLCLRSIRDARIAFESFVSEVILKDPGIKAESIPYRPTITVQREASDLFVTLRNKYKNVMSVEPMFGDLLNKIGEIFFNIRAPRSQQLNIFQDIMNSLLAPPGGGPSSPAGTSQTRINPRNEFP
ncbi:3691_t:CDS:2 [Acaulospora colombiana]|uniref:3691_t:CDS:1 n=1 Tax=Acaulospora colombiana TaxID=27376 RepID=A0ACA9KQ01_9GLOM|nr:3691_t:CDS:2 [Acaulospora colombiana]